jgi:hypothetical protein
MVHAMIPPHRTILIPNPSPCAQADRGRQRLEAARFGSESPSPIAMGEGLG